MIKKNQKGSVLLFVLILGVVSAIFSTSIIYLVRLNSLHNKNIGSNVQYQYDNFKALKSSIENFIKVGYSNSPIFKNKSGSLQDSKFQINISSTHEYPISSSLHFSSSFINYAYEISIENSKNKKEAKYNFIVNTPNIFNGNDSLENIETQNINLPSVDISNLSLSQKNSNGLIDITKAGFIGVAKINNQSHKLEFISNINNARYTANLPTSNTFYFTQGWQIEDGKWLWVLIIYDSKNNVFTATIPYAEINSSQSNSIAINWLDIGGNSNNEIAPEWNSEKPYTGGEKVTYNGIVYIANWWTDKPPDTDYSWQAQTDVWHRFNTYNAGDNISYNGNNYIAHHWTQSKPDTNYDWQLQSNLWHKFNTYNSGSVVSHNSKTYKAKWYTRSTPGTGNDWELIIAT